MFKAKKGLLFCSGIVILAKHYRFLVTRPGNMRILNVAEKNDAAKNIAALLSNGAARKVSNNWQDNCYVAYCQHEHHDFHNFTYRILFEINPYLLMTLEEVDLAINYNN